MSTIDQQRGNRFSLTGLSSFLMAFLLLVAGVYGQEEDEPSISELQDQVKKLKFQLESLQDRTDFVEEDVEEQREKLSGVALLPESEWTPGWERAKNDMQPGREEQFNLLLGRSGPMDVYMGVDTVGRFQLLEQDDVFIGGSKADSLSGDFQKAHGDVRFLATFNDNREKKDPYLEVYFDWFISSRHHTDMFGDEGYMLLRRIPEGPTFISAILDQVDLKAGEYELPFGDQIYRRTNNAAAQQNRLIGNSVVDGRATEIGVTVMNDSPSSEPGRINWLLNVSSGDPSPSFESGNGLAVLPKVWTNPTENLRLSASGYHVDQSDNGPGFPVGGDSSNLLTGNRDTGGVYEGVLDGGPDSGQVLFEAGQDVTALQGDLTYRTDTIELYGNIGWYSDQDPNGSLPGSPDEEWMYTTVEGVYHLSNRIYLAGRYSAAFADELVTSGGGSSVSSDGRVDRFQLGGGYWLTEAILFKVELVHQQYSSFDSAERQVSGVDSWRDPDFTGAIAEFTFSF